MPSDESFLRDIADRSAGYARREIGKLARPFMRETIREKYSYNYTFLSRPIIQYPQDMVVMQEIVWKVKPDLIIETGIAHGGSLVMSAALLALVDYCGAAEAGTMLDPRKPARRVLGIDIDIRPHNRAAIEAHPLASRIDLIEGSAIAPEVVERVRASAAAYTNILVCLDSNHTHAHVLAELEAYAPLVTKGSYCVVFDTIVEDLPDDLNFGRPWGQGNNPKTAVREYLRGLAAGSRTGVDGAPLQFEIDKTIEDKLLLTVAPDGYLRRL